MNEKLKYVAQYKIIGLFEEEPEEDNQATAEETNNVPDAAPNPFTIRFY